MTRVLLLLSLAVGVASPGRAQVRPHSVSLEDALTLALPASETVGLARAAILRADGEQYRARSERYPQLTGSLGFTRLIRSQFEDFSFGEDQDEDDLGALPFGRKNTYNLGLVLSQNLFAGGRIAGQTRAAEAGRRGAELELTAAEAQLTLDVVEAYFDAYAADLQVAIAEAGLAQADSTLRQTEQRRAVGTQPEFDVLRARVARDNQRTAVIARQAERDVAHLHLKQLLDMPMDRPIVLTTPPADPEGREAVTLTRLLASPGDTAPERRVAVRQAAEAVAAQEGLAQAARSQQLPQIVATSTYGHVGYPANLDPFSPSYFTNWNLQVGLQFPIFTGGRLKGDRTVAEAGVREAELRLAQATKAARVDVLGARTRLEAAGAAWDASRGTVEEAQRAYQIAELRFAEGLSTQTELLDARLALQTAESFRVDAARTLQVARVRMALIDRLPLGGGAAAPSTATRPASPSAPTPRTAGAEILPGTGVTP